MLKTILIIFLNISITLGLFYVFIFSKISLIEEGVHVKKDIIKDSSKIILSEGSILEGNIELNTGEIILKNNSKLIGDIYLNKGNIRIDENVTVIGNIYFEGHILIGKNTSIEGDISKKSNLNKHSTSIILGDKPSLYSTYDYPQFLKYFDVLPQKHKEAFGYIFLTSHNMDIRGKELKPEEYFKQIFIYKDKKLVEINKSKNKELLASLYKKSSEYINLLPERKVGRFGVAFVTKNYAQNKKFADMYVSNNSAEPLLFMHETGHVLDYKYAYIDYHNPSYPYPNKDSSITEYGKFHKGEDFAEAYRYYVLHNQSFKNKASKDRIIQEKYNYLKQYVFDGKEYN